VPTAWAADSDKHQFTVGFEGGYVHVDTPLVSWLDGGLGKLRYDESTDGLYLYPAFMEYKGRVTHTLSFKGVLNYQPELSNKLDVTEAYFEFRPVPRSRWRTRWRLGAFYPHLTMENVDVAWTTPYTLSSSAINTWLAEEVRIIGLEGKLSRDFGELSNHRVSVEGGIFVMNDPAGGLLSSKGWSVHNRQTGIRGEVPFVFGDSYKPFKELDHNAGFYGGLQYQYARTLKVKVHHYDNHGDPYQGFSWSSTWSTQFDSVGLQLAMPADVGLIGQWMDGKTLWQGGDWAFDAWSLMLTRAFKRHRLSVRYDDFFLDIDMPGQPVADSDVGSAWTAAWLFNYSKEWRFGLEWVEIESTRPYFAFSGLPNTITESQVMASIRYLFTNKK